MSYYVHNVQGRLRVKTPLIKGSRLMAQEIQKLLGQIRGVNTITVNTLTGSVVAHYDPKTVSSKELLDTLREAGYFDLSKAVTNDQYIYSAAAKTGGIIWSALAGAFVEQALEGSVLSLIAVLI